MSYKARYSDSRYDPESDDKLPTWTAPDAEMLTSMIWDTYLELLADDRDIGVLREGVETWESLERIGEYDFDGTPPFDDGFLHVEMFADPPMFAVEVLVHYNLTVEVEAESGEEAMEAARQRVLRRHPTAVLVDSISYHVVDESPAGGV